MFTGILILALVIFITVISYRRQRLEEKLIKQIPVIDWFLMFASPIFFYVGLIMIVRNILSRHRVNILDFEESQILGIGIFFMIYAIVGVSVHFVAKVLSRYIKRDRSSKVYQVNEIFHGKLSHYLTFACSYMLVFTLALLEINYPLPQKLSGANFAVLTGVGILAGFSAFKGIFYTHQWIGGYNKPFYLISLVFLIILVGIFKSDNLIIAYYPMNIFIVAGLFSVVCIYGVRRILFFSRLSRPRRIKIISRLFSMP